MAVLALSKVGDYLAFDEEQCRTAGRALAAEYRAASPFPHAVIDDLLDADVLRGIAGNYPALDGKQFFDRDQERFKFQFNPDEVTFGTTRNVLAELNGQAFLGFLQEMTGIEGLIADPYFVGGGLHLTRRGGHLGIHADFNIHGVMNVERRLNLLVYLNDGWQGAYGGELELWDKPMRSCVKSVAPVLGRAVVFNTALDSFHGQPKPLTCPEDRDRRSIATYYYTSIGDLAGVKQRTTTFQARPGTIDKPDRKVRIDHLIKDWVPPRLQGVALRLNPFK